MIMSKIALVLVQIYVFDVKKGISKLSRWVAQKNTAKVNGMKRHIETDVVTQTNKAAMAAALWVAKEVGVKKDKTGGKKEPWWKRRIESDITNLRRDINRLEWERRGETGGKGKKKIKKLNTKYKVKKKRVNLVIEELKQRLIAKKTKVKRYEQRISQFRQNQLFQVTKI